MTTARWRSHAAPGPATRERPTPAMSIGMSSATTSARMAPAACARSIRRWKPSSVWSRASRTSGSSSAARMHWWKARSLTCRVAPFQMTSVNADHGSDAASAASISPASQRRRSAITAPRRWSLSGKAR